MKQIWKEMFQAAKAVQNGRQMPNSYQEIEVLMDFETEEIVTLGELTPKWWI